MENNRADLESKIETLRARQTADNDNLEVVLELLRKADERRITEPNNRNMWNRVLDNLENSLIEARARVQSNSVELQKLERELEQMTGKSGHRPENVPKTEADSKTLGEEIAPSDMGVPQLSAEYARQILSRPVEEIAELTLKDVDSLYEKIASENVAAAVPETGPLLNALELTIPSEGKFPSGGKSDSTENRRKETLKGAIEKIQRNQVAQMSAEEVQMIFVTYDVLCKRVNRSPKDDRLRRILGAAVQIINRKRAKAWKEQQQQQQ